MQARIFNLKSALYFFLGIFLPTALYAKPPPFPLKSLDFPVQIRSLHFHPQGSELSIGGYRNTYIWDLKHRKVKLSLPSPLCQTRSMQFSPRGRYIFPTERHCQKIKKYSLLKKRDKIQLWDLQNKAKSFFFGKHLGVLKLIKIDPQEKYLASIAQDGTVKVWSLSQKKLLYSLRIPRHPQEALAVLPYALSPKLNIMALQNWQDYYMLLYSLPHPAQSARKAKAHLQNFSKKVRLLHRTEYPFLKTQELFCFSPSQKFYFDGLRIRQSKDGRIQNILSYHPDSNPQKAIFNPQGSLLALLSQIKKKNSKNKEKPSFQIEVYKISSQGKASYLRSFPLASKAQSFAFHPNGRIIALADEKKKLHFFQVPRSQKSLEKF